MTLPLPMRKLALYLITLFSFSFLFSFFGKITIFSLFSCYKYSFKDMDPRYNNYLEEMVAGYYSYHVEDGPMRADDDHQLASFQRFGKVDFITASSTTNTVNVDDHGAIGNGVNDDTEAFQKAWEEACSSRGDIVLEVPEGKSYLLKPIRFKGPCKSNLTIKIYGSLEASEDRSDYKEDRKTHWLVFQNVKGLLMEGGGTINGNGKIWWLNSCKVNKHLPCKRTPNALTFYKSKNLVVRNLNIQDAQRMHVTFSECSNVQASNLRVTAPEKSPNTDGIHVTHTQNIHITDSVIGTGDDCISIVSGSENVHARGITCGPGHGISIGSLGSRNYRAYVSGVTVDGAKISGTTNGVRIKTWQGGSGSATNIKFQNIEMINVTNPIIIDQNYCDQRKPCKEESSAVQVKDVVYRNIKGTSVSKVAMKFDCSKSYPCQGIVLEDVNLQRQGNATAKAICNNVKLSGEEKCFPTTPLRGIRTPGCDL